MWPHTFILALAVFVASISQARTSQAQPLGNPTLQVNPLFQEVEARNSVAKFEVSLAPAQASLGQEVVLSIKAFIQHGWHIGALVAEGESAGLPSQIRFEPVGLEAIDGQFACSEKAIEQQLGVGSQWLLEGSFTWTRSYRVVSEQARYGGTGTIRFQACDDQRCLPPQSVEFCLGHAALSTASSNSAAANDSNIPTADGEKPIGEPLVLRLEPCELTRPRPQVGNPLTWLVFGRPTEKLVWQATIPTGPDAGVALYLPKAKRYSLQNTGSDDTKFGNTATYVSIDQDKDGTIAEWEAAAANRAIRIRDSMYRVTAIDIESKTLTLQQVDAPLKGALVGYRCPEFEYTALDGSVISNKSILGKTTVLDIWAVTCHNCYEGFPKIQKALNKHSAEKLRVVLLTVDTDRQFYDKRAPKLFETYGGGTWPQVMIPGGFNGAITFGDYGFGSVVVDEAGIVRAVGALGVNIESILDEVMSNPVHRASLEDGAARRATAATLRTTIDRESLQNCFPGLTERLDKLRAEGELLTAKMITSALANPMGLPAKPQLPSLSSVALSPAEIVARLRKSKLHVGWFFKCNHCDNWHVNFGAGFPVTDNGIIATCNHVVTPPISEMKEGYLVVLDGEGKIYKVEGLIAADTVSDCALLKIAGAEGLRSLPLNLAPQVGGDAYVLSNPLGMSDYFTHGLINRVFVNSTSIELSERETKRNLRLNVGADWAPGSSGAPIVDQCGNLIGFVSAARQLLGPPGQAVQADGQPHGGPSVGLTTLLTAHEAGTTTAIEMLIAAAVKASGQ